MRTLLAIAGIALLYTDIPPVQQTRESFQPILIEAAKSAQECAYQTERASADKNGKASGMWEPTNEGAGSLAKIAQGDKGYLEAMELLEGSVSVDPITGLRHTEAIARGELPRFWLIFKIRELWFSIAERFTGTKWVPESFQARVRVDVGIRLLSKEVRRIYRVKTFKCGTD